MSIKQNALELAVDYPLAAKTVNDVDDFLSGADSIEEAVALHNELQSCFSQAGFLLRKWNSSEPEVLHHISSEILDAKSVHSITDGGEYTKTLGIGWSSSSDHFRLTVTDLSSTGNLTKRVLVSSIAKMFDVLGL